MSYESDNTLAESAALQEVMALIEMLGYRRYLGPAPKEWTKIKKEVYGDNVKTYDYFYFDDTDYHSYDVIELGIIAKPGQALTITTRSRVGRSYHDLMHQNKTIKLLKQFFGGSFVTDEGKGRYQQPDGRPQTPPEAGCHLAFHRFGSNLIRADLYVEVRNFGPHWEQDVSPVSGMADLDPKLLSNNMLLPYLVAIMEDYFKSTFIALLKYSDRKETVLKSARLSAEHLARISAGEMTVEEAFAETLPFQRISQICNYFTQLIDSKLDFAGILKKPYRRRKESLFELIERMVLSRHAFIHRSALNYALDHNTIISFMDDVEASVERCYRRLTDHYGWVFDKGWGRGKHRRRPAANPQ
jgi:hypothetical protein